MIEVKQLSKYFGRQAAVDDISFTVGRGEVLGFLGPNAAGKSTTMRMITGFLPPASGTAVIGGDDIIQASLAARRKMGYLPENAPVYPDMTVVGFLDFVAGIRGFSGREKRHRIEETIERCFLGDVRLQMISTLSKGFKQRVCFAQSILHDPEYLIMDEPTDGLDPNQKHEVRLMIREMSREKTIILSTHILEEVEAVCTRAIIIAAGRVVIDKAPEELKAASRQHGAVCLTVRRAPDEDLVREIGLLPFVKDVEVLGQSDKDACLRIYPKELAAVEAPAENILRYFIEKGRSVQSLHVEEGRLDEVFRKYTAAGE